MRRPILRVRDSRSTVQITSLKVAKDILKDVANARPVNLSSVGTFGTYDFDGDDPDFDKELLEEAPNKIDQSVHFSKYQTKEKQSSTVDIPQE